MGLTSQVNLAKAGSKSLRTTIPEGIVAYMSLQEGDALEWDMEVARNRKIVIITKTTGTRNKRT